MSFPAATVTSQTAHAGVVVGPGVPTVLIGGLPAAVVGDMASCTLPPPPAGNHVPMTPIANGSATVLIGGRPAARVTSQTGCPSNVIIMGCTTVLIGG